MPFDTELTLTLKSPPETASTSTDESVYPEELSPVVNCWARETPINELMLRVFDEFVCPRLLTSTLSCACAAPGASTPASRRRAAAAARRRARRGRRSSDCGSGDGDGRASAARPLTIAVRSGALALWRSGALALWRSGALALWRSGALALWRSGAHCNARLRADVKHIAGTHTAEPHGPARAFSTTSLRSPHCSSLLYKMLPQRSCIIHADNVSIPRMTV